VAVIVDSSVWVDILAGQEVTDVENAMAEGSVVLPPLVVAELLSGTNTPADRAAIGELLQDIRLHDTPLEHWMRAGELRRMLRSQGVNVSIPDAHVAQCALDMNAIPFSRDEIFVRIARHTSLRLAR